MNLMLTWVNGSGVVQNTTQAAALTQKPALSFLFDAIYYEPDANNFFYTSGPDGYVMTPEQITEVDQFVANYDFGVLLVHGVDNDGVYLGYGVDGDFPHNVPDAPPGDGFYVWDFGTPGAWKYILGVNSNGEFLGNVELDKLYAQVPHEPPAQHYEWDFGESKWYDPRPLSVVKGEAAQAVDMEAGETRKTYITFAPGQAETYIMKATEAKEFLAATAPDVNNYPMVKAEYEVLVKYDDTIIPADAANYIVATQTQWLTLAAAVEKVRRMAKEDISRATTNQDVNVLKNTAIATLVGMRAA